jgi:DNA-binding MarR family transcriptional regulator
VTQLIAELERAGLLRIEVDDGDISFVLTESGRTAARSTAMSRQDHALVLLGALVGTEHRPN